MKNLIIAVLLIAGLSSFAQDKKEMGKLTPEQRNQLMLKKMTLDLDLNAKQQEQMKPIIAEQSAKIEAMRVEQKEKREKQKAEFLARKNKMLDEQIAMKNKMKTILTPEQFEKWNTHREKQQNRFSGDPRKDNHRKNKESKE